MYRRCIYIRYGPCGNSCVQHIQIAQEKQTVKSWPQAMSVHRFPAQWFPDDMNSKFDLVAKTKVR